MKYSVSNEDIAFKSRRKKRNEAERRKEKEDKFMLWIDRNWSPDIGGLALAHTIRSKHACFVHKLN